MICTIYPIIAELRHLAEIGQVDGAERLLKMRDTRRASADVSKCRCRASGKNPIFRRRREKRTNPTSDSASPRKMIMVDAGGGLGERQGAGFRSSDNFCWSRLVAEALLQSRAASSGIARCPMPTEPSRSQPLAKQWLSASRCLSN